eukprot:m51a1_g5279 putative tellurium resistance protein TerZ (401) ;mRNA; f:170873-173925
MARRLQALGQQRAVPALAQQWAFEGCDRVEEPLMGRDDCLGSDIRRQQSDTHGSGPGLLLSVALVALAAVVIELRTERRAMADLEKNKLWVSVVEARNVPAADIGGTSDPYVKIKDVDGLGGHGAKTNWKKKTLNPVWNETFEFDFNYKLQGLHFHVFDHDMVGSDDLIGKCSVSLCVLYDGQEHDMWVPMYLSKGGVRKMHGDLHLKLRAQWRLPIAPVGVWLPIPAPNFTLGLGWDFSKKKPPVDLDASVVALDVNNRILATVSFRQKQAFGNAISHQGDNRTGQGSGDDERVNINLAGLPPTAVKLVFVINSFTGAPLSAAKSAYLRLVDSHRTLAFMRIDQMVGATGLFFGYMAHTTAGWHFQTIARPANGRVVTESMNEIVPLINHISPPLFKRC